MRKNFPVTGNEYELGADTLIVSKTDIKGKLTYFNEQFVAASGFTEQELMGQPHNIVRHPDMPPEAFENLWDTLKAGRSWVGAVKNRRKDGGFYWVLASATPIWENGKVTGYMSVRTKLPADQRKEAEHVYALLRENKAQKFRVDAGIIRRRSWLDLFAPFTRSLSARLTTLVAVLASLMVVIGAAGIAANYVANASTKTIYQQRTAALGKLIGIKDAITDDANALRGAFIRSQLGEPQQSDVAGRVRAGQDNAAKLISELTANKLSPDEYRIATELSAKHRAYSADGVRVALDLLSQAKFNDLGRHLTGAFATLREGTTGELEKLVALQTREAKAEYDSSQNRSVLVMLASIGLIVGGAVVAVLFGVATMRAIVRPMGRLNAAMENIARGQLNSRIFVERDDEIGMAIRNIEAMQNKLAFDREQEQHMARRTAELRRQDMHRLANDFETAVGEVIDTVSSASTELEASAGSLTSTAERSQQLTMVVATASEHAAANVQSVASATEEMTSSVGEISRQVQESARIAHDAVEQAQRTNSRVGELSQAAGRIGTVVELINSIAGQTNLLALNATIEAARAGDAGRGFAVVAAEVKALAEQTAKATGEISQQISAIQTVTDESVTAIREIGVTIDRMSEIASTIAAAVEQQGAATQEIARNVQQAAEGTMQVSVNIAGVQRGAGETGSASSQVLAAAQELARDSNRLKAEVSNFLNTVRAA